MTAARGIAQRAGLVKVKGLAVKTLWLQEFRDRGLQNQSGVIEWTNALPVARLNALRAASGIVVSREPTQPSALHLMLVTLQNLCIKARTQKHNALHTFLLRAFTAHT